MIKRENQEKLKYYQKLKDFYLKTYWENNDRKDIFSPNGFQSLPEKTYQAFALQIDHGGKILDLGCGNGLLLKYLIETLGYKLTPYGVDFMELSIKQAKEILFPEFQENFEAKNIADYSFEKGPFDFIITCLHYIAPEDRKEFLKKIKRNCKKGGKVIFHEYSEDLNHSSFSCSEEYPELKNWKLIRKDYPGVSMRIWKRN